MSVDWSLLADEVLLACVGTLNLLLWLLLRRRTPMGRALSSHMLAIALLYYGALLGMHFDAFRSPAWRAAIRVMVGGTTAYALWALVGYFGGWRATTRELRRGVVELVGSVREAGAMLVWRVRRWRENGRL